MVHQYVFEKAGRNFQTTVTIKKAFLNTKVELMPLFPVVAMGCSSNATVRISKQQFRVGWAERGAHIMWVAKGVEKFVSVLGNK